VIYVLAGTGRIVVGDEEVTLALGDVVVAPARIPHQVRAAADEELDTLVAMPATLRTFRPDGSEIQQPWHT
jgi:quercetin dioxygenase-like cupin family protein